MNVEDLEYEKINMETGEIEEPDLNVVARIEKDIIIVFNQEEIEKNLQRVEKMYEGILFQEDQIQVAKKERAKLNALSNKIQEARKKVINDATKGIKPFENYMKKAATRAKKVANEIDSQIAIFEDTQKQIRKAISIDYLKSLVKENPQYSEFLGDIDLDEKIFTNGTSYKNGKVGPKIKEYISVRLKQVDEILLAREVQIKLLQEKTELIKKCCEKFTIAYNLKLKLNENVFNYLKDYELTDILEKIENAALEQQQQENVLEQATVIEETIEVEPVDQIQVEPESNEKKYNFSLKISNCNLEKSKLLKGFLEVHKYEFTTESIK